jgi:LysM repeat protein
MSGSYSRRPLIALLLAIALLLPAIASAQESGDPLTHIVQPGENLYRIAQRYGVDVQLLAETNSITNQSRIFAGQVLIIPGLTVPDASAAVVNPLVAGTPITHVVQPGESLTIIANQYNVTVDEILQANNIPNPNRIYRGQELMIWTPQSVAAAEPDSLAPELIEGVAPTETLLYTVQAGETLGQIARRYGLDWQVLAQMNNLPNPDQVYAGQQITIPAVDSSGNVIDMGILTPAVSGPAATILVGKQIIVDLSDSRIYAYQDGVLVRSALASTGLPATPTVQGDFRIYLRLESQTMSGPGYNLPGVQWVQYFYQGYGIHGTYWHNNFGQPMSRGCVNLPNHEAQWFYNWAEHGTPVRVQA